MYGVVYLIWNKVNGKKYVGQTVQPLKVRFNEHVRKKDNMLIGKAIRKYGKENFYCGVIKTCESKEELDYWEKFFIAALKSKKTYGYNLTDGGEGFIGYHPTPEMRAKQSAIHKGKPHSPEWCAKISAAHKGKTISVEQRAKISATSRGNNPYKNLLYELEERQLSYKALSKLIEMPLSSLSYKMQGVRKFTEADRVKLEEFFGKSADYLFECNF